VQRFIQAQKRLIFKGIANCAKLAYRRTSSVGLSGRVFFCLEPSNCPVPGKREGVSQLIHPSGVEGWFMCFPFGMKSKAFISPKKGKRVYKGQWPKPGSSLGWVSGLSCANFARTRRGKFQASSVRYDYRQSECCF
jgi:hypothetical protein